MRLVCPKCEAEYEVADDMIPPEGRDVQCSNCSKLWYQAPAHYFEEEAREESEPSEGGGLRNLTAATQAQQTPKAPSIDPEALDVIHEEVELEQTRRAVSELIETQSDLELDTPARDPSSDADVLAPAPRRETSNRRLEHLPDIEELTSTLESTPPPSDEPASAPKAKAQPLQKRRRGFRVGFALMLVVTTCLLSIYVAAGAFSERFPDYAPMIAAYVEKADIARVWLEGAADGFVEQLNELIGKITE